MFRVGLQYLDCRIAALLNQTPSWYFLENFSNFRNQLFFVASTICVEKLNYIKNYTKTRRETREGGQSSPHFVLRNKTEHLNYTRRGRSAKYERFVKTFFKTCQDGLIWKFFCEIKTTLFSSLRFFLFITSLPRNSILCYASIISSMLEEFRPVSAQTILCKSSHYWKFLF